MILRLLLATTSVLRSAYTENGVQKIELFFFTKVSWLIILTERNSGCAAQSGRMGQG